MKTKSFTLIEILFAVVILAMALGVTLALSAQAKGDLIRAKERWFVQHAMEQATEYFLSTDPAELHLPDNLLPGGFYADCTIDPVEDGLPEYATVENYRSWKLCVYTISVYDRNGELRDQQYVHKILPWESIF